VVDDPATAVSWSDVGEAGNRGGHCRLVLDEEAGPAVDDQLRGGAFFEGDHRGAARQRLDHDHPERLLPANRHQQPARPREERALPRPPDLAREADPLAVDMGGDLLVEEGLLTGLDDPRQDQWSIRESGDVDRPMRPLAGGHPADPEEKVILLLAKWPLPRRDRVRDHRERPQAGRRIVELGLADADK